MAAMSTMLALGTPLPSFTLENAVDGARVASSDLRGERGVLVMFLCNHCPYVVHVRPELAKVAAEALAQGFSVVAINSNSVRVSPQDGPSHMKELAREDGWRFPFLFDATQDVARAFAAAATPEVYLFDAQRKLVYRGRVDDSSPKNGKPLTGADLRAALRAVAEGRAPEGEQLPSIGCSIKWD